MPTGIATAADSKTLKRATLSTLEPAVGSKMNLGDQEIIRGLMITRERAYPQ